VSDKGFAGLVIQVSLKGIEIRDGFEITAQAGEDWDRFVAFCVQRNLAGVECLSGIPGFVGGTPVQNVGAYGQEVSETIVAVRCFDRQRGEIVDLTNRDCGFTYRTSIFNSTERDRYVVLSVTYALTPDGRPKIVYKDLKEHFEGREPTLAETREAVLKIRRLKSMVIDDADPNSRSAGSFFKNPIVAADKVEQISAAAGVENVPNFPAPDSQVKIPAAWLIERSGFGKGFRLGNAGISSNHSLALINAGGATAAEIVALKEKIQDGVRKKFDILLLPEPVFVGFD
jgi:UDP-N-acetylmuramate dehydrogenase